MSNKYGQPVYLPEGYIERRRRKLVSGPIVAIAVLVIGTVLMLGVLLGGCT